MSEYDPQSDHPEPHLPTVREALEPYLVATESGPYAKLSISVPESLLRTVREVADETGTSVSGVVAATLRRLVDEVEQAKLDAALEADREENLAWARATAPMDALLLADVEW
jgi:hypothetical protein